MGHVGPFKDEGERWLSVGRLGVSVGSGEGGAACLCSGVLEEERGGAAVCVPGVLRESVRGDESWRKVEVGPGFTLECGVR